MNKIVLELDYGTKVLNNLEKTWIQPHTIGSGYMLCYKDSEWDREIIYRSNDKAYLKRLQDKLMKAVSKGEKYIRL